VHPGLVRPTPRGAVYCLSRPAEIGYGISGGIARFRPLINTRDDVRTAAGYRRLRVSVSDPSMSETTTLLKAVSTDLVLRMIEAGTALPDLTLDQPVQALAEVSLDITGRSQVRLARGRELSALDIQREYLATATQFAARRGADPVSRRALDLWQRTLDAIAAGDLDAIAREIDWVIKYQLIERFRAAHDLPLSAPQVAWADLAYHDISRAHGLHYLLQRTGAVDRTAHDLDIFAAKTHRPDPRRYRQAG
jgi:proteasome accessory factor A